ncbi:MAG: hypothetical protein P8K08_23995 [Fuerstiella sp.]|nr:hypothetical protein [Fuerstiella sp.]
MGKAGGDPDIATLQWFVSLDDNSTILDPQNGALRFSHVSFTPSTGLPASTFLALVRVMNSDGYSNWSALFDFLIGLSAPGSVSVTSPSLTVVNGLGLGIVHVGP